MIGELKVVHLLPDDVVLIGNLGECEDGALEQCMGQLREKLPTANGLFVFAGDIDVEVLHVEALADLVATGRSDAEIDLSAGEPSC